MLVSSIGYFDAKLNNNYADSSMKNQPAKKNLSEGFGQYGKMVPVSGETTGFMKTILSAIKSLFSKNKVEDHSKYTSLIA